jgi:pyridoxine kinase
MNSVSSLRTVIKIHKELREKNSNIKWFCDPVMGDDGKLYVNKDLVSIYRDEVVPQSDFVFPNQTEAE